MTASETNAQRLLLIAIGLAGGFGLALVALPGLTEQFFNWLIFGSTESPAGFSGDAQEYLRFVYGVLGAVIMGWMALAASIVARRTSKRRSVAAALATSIGLWFMVDTSHSLVSGYPENASLNVVFLATLGFPLWLFERSSS